MILLVLAIGILVAVIVTDIMSPAARVFTGISAAIFTVLLSVDLVVAIRQEG